MKTDRLLSIIIYLLNRELVSASELANHFGVSTRTIQRDMDTINLAGIPIMTIQGPNGGYSIMNSWRLDRQLLSMDNMFFLMTALNSIESTLPDKKLSETKEKVKSLLPGNSDQLTKSRQERLHIDFSMLGGSEQHKRLTTLLDETIENRQSVEFIYTNNKLESTRRLVDPLTVVFKWRSWYLYAWCREKEDYRLFRIGKIKELRKTELHFHRHELMFEDFMARGTDHIPKTTLVLKFAPFMKSVVEDFYADAVTNVQKDGSIMVEMQMPEDGWLYGFLLSYGPWLEVIEPKAIRIKIKKMAEQIAEIY